MVDVCLVLSQLSFCTSYFIFIVLNIPSVLPTPAPGSLLEYVLTADVLIALQVFAFISTATTRSRGNGLRAQACAICTIPSRTAVFFGGGRRGYDLPFRAIVV